MASCYSWSCLITTSLITLYSLGAISLFWLTILANFTVFSKKIYPNFVVTVLSKENINNYCQLPDISMSALYLYQIHVYLMKATFVESKINQ